MALDADLDHAILPGPRDAQEDVARPRLHPVQRRALGKSDLFGWAVAGWSGNVPIVDYKKMLPVLPKAVKNGRFWSYQKLMSFERCAVARFVPEAVDHTFTAMAKRRGQKVSTVT